MTRRIREQYNISISAIMVGLVTAILSASAFTILQAVDGIALKIAVNTWYGLPPEEEERKAIIFRVAEGIRCMEWATQAYYRMLTGAVALIFGVAIAKSRSILVDGLDG